MNSLELSALGNVALSQLKWEAQGARKDFEKTGNPILPVVNTCTIGIRARHQHLAAGCRVGGGKEGKGMHRTASWCLLAAWWEARAGFVASLMNDRLCGAQYLG